MAGSRSKDEVEPRMNANCKRHGKRLATEKMCMINQRERPIFKTQRKRVLKEISKLREQREDLTDYLDLLDARVRNQGKPRLSADAIRKQIGIV